MDKGAHDALDALTVGIARKKVNWSSTACRFRWPPRTKREQSSS